MTKVIESLGYWVLLLQSMLKKTTQIFQIIGNSSHYLIFHTLITLIIVVFCFICQTIWNTFQFTSTLSGLDGRCFLRWITLQIGDGEKRGLTHLCVSTCLSACWRLSFNSQVCLPLPGKKSVWHLWSSVLSTNLYHLLTFYLRNPTRHNAWLN